MKKLIQKSLQNSHRKHMRWSSLLKTAAARCFSFNFCNFFEVIQSLLFESSSEQLLLGLDFVLNCCVFARNRETYEEFFRNIFMQSNHSNHSNVLLVLWRNSSFYTGKYRLRILNNLLNEDLFDIN